MALIVAPISIKEAIGDLTTRIAQIRRKTTTLIDYYIYPNDTPSEVEAYDPRLMALQNRLNILDKIKYPNLAYILDDSDALAASYLNDVIDQLLNAVHGVQDIFESHYDRDLAEKKPFNTIYKVLEHREKQLKELIQFQMTDPRKLRPEDLRANEQGEFCRGAIQMINNRDRGKISYVEQRELLDENRARMKAFGGAFLFWGCQECTFRVRYHVSNSSNSSIHSTDEVRDHKGVSAEYKSAFLAKCHLFQPAPVRGGRGSRGSISAGPKYGCLFCFSMGKKLARGETAFSTGRQLAEHISEKHRKTLPPGPLLQKFNVSVKGRLADGVRRWDVNLK